VFYVIGDHGMTDSGDHGGDSLEETKTALFVYSKRGLPFADHSRELRQIDIGEYGV
jgi:phosphatidylinositol glycan class O